MNFLFYLLIVFLAIISNSTISIILTTLRVGLSFCSEISKSPEYEDYEQIAAAKLKNKYYITLIIDFLLVTIISCIVVFLLPKYNFVYWALIIVFTLISIPSTGKNNQNNIKEFYNSLQCNYPQGDSTDSRSNKIIQELIKKSGLSEQLCTDIFEILVCFSYNDKELAHSKINTQLIPHLKDTNDIGIIGIAFGMLIGENALTQEESTRYSSHLIEELIMNE